MTAQGKEVFISHVHEEAELAREIKMQITRAFGSSCRVFVSTDTGALPAGTRWLSELDTALKTTSVLLLLCSPDSVKRPWVNFEAGSAWVRGIPIIPLCHAGLSPKQLPLPMSTFQAVDLASPSALDGLITSLSFHLGLPSLAPAESPDPDGKQARFLTNRGPPVKRILLGASRELADAMKADAEAIRTAYPDAEMHLDATLTARTLTEALRLGTWDLVQLTVDVSSDGDLVFGQSTWHERLPKEGLASFLQRASTRLLVLTCCNSVPLAATLSGKVNMIAATGNLECEGFLAWESVFFPLLASGDTLARAFEVANQAVRLPVTMIGNPEAVLPA